MKKTTLLLVALTMSIGMYAQRDRDCCSGFIKKNEVKLNLPLTIFASFPEVYYERVLAADLSLGASLGASLNNKDYPFNFIFAPYGRWFFGGAKKSMEKAASGFFIEVNGALLSQRKNWLEVNVGQNPPNESSKESIFGAGLGMAVGWKYLSRNNWVGDVFWGGGKDFVNNSFYPRIGVSLGKRF